MTNSTEKVAYVKSATKHDGQHHCHWKGCNKVVPPAMWGCKTHWFMLPANLRARIWATYKPEQEINKTPSAEYLQIAIKVQKWIQQNTK